MREKIRRVEEGKAREGKAREGCGGEGKGEKVVDKAYRHRQVEESFHLREE